MARLISLHEAQLFEAANIPTSTHFWCIVCKGIKAFPSEVGSIQASLEIGGWACGHHTPEELQQAKDSRYFVDRQGCGWEYKQNG